MLLQPKGAPAPSPALHNSPTAPQTPSFHPVSKAQIAPGMATVKGSTAYTVAETPSAQQLPSLSQIDAEAFSSRTAQSGGAFSYLQSIQSCDLHSKSCFPPLQVLCCIIVSKTMPGLVQGNPGWGQLHHFPLFPVQPRLEVEFSFRNPASISPPVVGLEWFQTGNKKEKVFVVNKC